MLLARILACLLTVGLVSFFAGVRVGGNHAFRRIKQFADLFAPAEQEDGW
jgi:hypothetical protein